ncbi:MAG: winged helix-turn-helix domain-containing protein [Streptosporangiaceae bacterium]
MTAEPIPQPDVCLSADDVRRVSLRAQGLLGADARRERVPTMLRRLGAVQLDTISVLARSHELVAYARLGPVGRARVESAYWSRPAVAFEHIAHAACVLPIEEWPTSSFRRRAFRSRGMRWHEVSQRACREVLARLRADGPLTAAALGGAKAGGPWWDWSEAKIAVEWLLCVGEVVCTYRQGWRRVYDLPERALPSSLLDQDPSDQWCLTRLVRLAGRALGVATRADLADYYRLRGEQVDAVVDGSGLIPVTVEGWGAAWADPDALASSARGHHRTTLLSPFDSLIWDRKRTERLFGFNHRLEAYVPRGRRVHGYFVMPLLAGGRLIGRVDPGREGHTLVAKQLSLRHASAVDPMARALGEAAAWVGCDSVRVGHVDPPALAAPLATALVG